MMGYHSDYFSSVEEITEDQFFALGGKRDRDERQTCSGCGYKDPEGYPEFDNIQYWFCKDQKGRVTYECYCEFCSEKER